MNLPIDSITISDMQARVRTDQATVDEYAEALAAGVEFPPVLVFHDGSDYHLADGVHRLLACQTAGIGEVPADVRTGTRADAKWASAGANLAHGLRRTNADKRRAVEIALTLRPSLSDRAIAEHCGVHHDLVGRVRNQVAESATLPKNQLADSASWTQVVANQRPVPSRPPQIPPVAPSKRTGSDGKARAVPRKPDVLDKVGRVIPEHLHDLWRRGDEVRRHLHAISQLRGALRAAGKVKDPLYAEVNHTAALAHLDQAYAALTVAIPYAVCPTCQGKTSQGCRMCHERGLISEFRWDRAVPKETRSMVFKLVEGQ